jgi:uncharacterized protein YutE (UPF0331/DUF86 family)
MVKNSADVLLEIDLDKQEIRNILIQGNNEVESELIKKILQEVFRVSWFDYMEKFKKFTLKK